MAILKEWYVKALLSEDGEPVPVVIGTLHDDPYNMNGRNVTMIAQGRIEGTRTIITAKGNEVTLDKSKCGIKSAERDFLNHLPILVPNVEADMRIYPALVPAGIAA